MITSSNARIETCRTSKNLSAWMDIGNARDLSNYAIEIRFMPNQALFLLCTRKDNPLFLYLIAAPSNEWKKDIEDAGYTIIQKLRMPTVPEEHINASKEER